MTKRKPIKGKITKSDEGLIKKMAKAIHSLYGKFSGGVEWPLINGGDACEAWDRVVSAENAFIEAKNSIGISRNLAETCLNELADYIDILDNLKSEMSEAVEEMPDDPVKVASLAEIEQGLKYLVKKYPKVKLVPSTYSIYITTPDIYLEYDGQRAHIGNLLLELNLAEVDDLINQYAPTTGVIGIVETEGTVKIDEYGIHPHVDNDELCLGDGEEVIITALREARIADVVEIVVAVLNTYGPSLDESAKPYWDITRWLDVNCEVCNYQPEKISLNQCCLRCDRRACINCQVKCKSCAKATCKACDKNYDGNCLCKTDAVGAAEKITDPRTRALGITGRREVTTIEHVADIVGTIGRPLRRGRT